MIRLKNKYEGKAALVIMGGPSIIENNVDLGLINKDKYTVFLESKALTPRFLDYGLEPDFFLMFFPEKCHSNSLQHVMYQSFLADIDLSKLLKTEYCEEYYHLKNNFDHYFEVWNPDRGRHKKYKWKNSIVLKNSPFDLLPNLPHMGIITRVNSEAKFPAITRFKNNKYVYDDRLMKDEFSLEKYYNPTEVNGCVMLNGYGHLNSAAIALFPLLFYMGFKKIYLIGMDMSMLGSMEYSSLYTFNSLRCFGKFFKKAIPVFNHAFKRNQRKFMRPPYEFDDMKKVMAYEKIEFVNICEPFEFAAFLEWVMNISFKEFLQE